MRPLVVDPVCTDKPRRSSRPAVRVGQPRGIRLELRVDVLERAQWTKAATREGYLSVSDWVRDRLNRAAALGVRTSSKRDDWCTPLELLELVWKVWRRIELDPCSNAQSIVNAHVTFDLALGADGLARSWYAVAHGLVYVNPPYGRRIAAWIEKCRTESTPIGRVEILALVPARVDTRWWRGSGARHVFWPGRLTYLGAPSPAPFPVALLYWGRDDARWARFCKLVARSPASSRASRSRSAASRRAS